ncbi:hypothetical protein RIF29_16818 [Crotalaria pallida]|uniref:Secreted protein n=1 Tax=Crotalaria pallida TaxID=3830 RepID=A0AAN9IK35_CROPI
MMMMLFVYHFLYMTTKILFCALNKIQHSCNEFPLVASVKRESVVGAIALRSVNRCEVGAIGFAINRCEGKAKRCEVGAIALRSSNRWSLP